MKLQHVRQEKHNAARQRLYRQAIVIALIGNLLLAVMKGIIAWLSGSSAVFSDAANSVSDVLYSLLMAGGLYLAQQPADESHPQGHSRFEPLVSLLIAAAMTAAGLAAIREAIQRFFSGAPPIQTGWPSVVLVSSGLIKVVMYGVVKRIGDQAHSPAIAASARDNLSDVLTSAAALAGVWGARLAHPLADPIAGVLVALWIFRSTWEILYENLGYLTGRRADPALVERIAETASQTPGVLGVHQVIADHVGPQVRVDMHIDVDGELSLYQAHEIADQVQADVEALSSVDLVFVHLEPSEALNQAQDQVGEASRLGQFHDR